ncbi:lytic murein transglycosylase [Sphingomonas sediminicola]|uniref:lytic murein transglycosylase n=1 Tax=Sphingomonas sediminicola TaxID=386874 RepID=UPI0031B5F27D
MEAGRALGRRGPGFADVEPSSYPVDASGPRCERVYARHSRWLTVGQWRSIGVVPYGSSLSDQEVATLLEPDGPNGTAYLLTGNYRAILDYNCSNFYALSVGLLANAITRR